MEQPPAKRAKTQQLPLPLPRAQVVPWHDLSPELIVRMAKYVDIGDDMTGLCVVVGPIIADRIRRAYLTGNDAYLAYALSLERENTDTAAAACACRIRFWMAVNSNWRDRCIEISHQQKVWHYRDFSLAPSLLHHIGRRVIVDDNGPRALVDANGIPVILGSSNEDIFLRVLGGDAMARHCVTVPVECIFNSPIIATHLGLAEVVKTLFDKQLLGVHDFLPFRIQELTRHISLLGAFFLDSSGNSILHYLLSRDDFDPCAPWDRDRPNDKPVNLATRAENTNPEAFKLMLDHPSCSPDSENRRNGRSALHYLCKNIDDRSHAVAKMKILLAAGANPALLDRRGKTPRDYLIKRLNNARREEDIDLMIELLATLQKAIRARRLARVTGEHIFLRTRSRT